MKKAIALMLLLAGCATGKQRLQKSEVDTSHLYAGCGGYVEHKWICFTVTTKDFLNAPKWDAKQGWPPLSPRDAEKLAAEKLPTLLKDSAGWRITSINLENHNDGYWLYVVHFEAPDWPEPGALPMVEIPVLMDGRIVSPEFRYK